MTTFVTWLTQFALVAVPMLTTWLAWQTARKRDLGEKAPALNGSYGILRLCVERLQALQLEYDHERTVRIRLEAQLAECRKRHGDPSAESAAPVRAPRTRQSTGPRTRRADATTATSRSRKQPTA